ncbi:hypothetical protein LJB42_004004 [Komagataella kurtzmanii]|nr:hypothetical protein LJB42_004004 [Komagataella kurtzmanii]
MSETENAPHEKSLLDDQVDFTVKHPLNSEWTLWYTKPAVHEQESWSDLLRPIISFNSVEEFWGIFNSIPKASDLPVKSDYHLFRDGIKPEWEDERNANGGKLTYQFAYRKVDINELWSRGLLSVIGETIQDDDGETEVNGIVLSIRRAALKIALWTKSKDESVLRPIGERFKKVLKLTARDHIDFQPHKSGAGSKNVPSFSI